MTRPWALEGSAPVLAGVFPVVSEAAGMSVLEEPWLAFRVSNRFVTHARQVLDD